MSIQKDKIKEIIQEAGVDLSKNFGIASVTDQKSKSPADVVTKLDRSTETFLAKEFEKVDPTIGFFGEEFGSKKEASKFWLVDPIDGTAHFVRGLPFCTTMVTLIDQGQVVFSVIYNFITKELYEAELGKGAFLNGKKIHVSNRQLSDAYLSVESDLKREEDQKHYLDLKKRSIYFKTINCGYEYGLIASGKIEGRICFSPYGKDWDYAPGSLLVTEAGGVVKNIGKNNYDYTNHDFIASNMKVYEELTNGPTALFPHES